MEVSGEVRLRGVDWGEKGVVGHLGEEEGLRLIARDPGGVLLRGRGLANARKKVSEAKRSTKWRRTAVKLRKLCRVDQSSAAVRLRSKADRTFSIFPSLDFQRSSST